jgi:hypothetical protein
MPVRDKPGQRDELMGFFDPQVDPDGLGAGFREDNLRP